MPSSTALAQGVARRMEIIAFIRQFIEQNGWPPTIAEIALACGLSSPNSTRNHLLRLADEGYLTIKARQARAIACTDPAPDGWTRGAVRPQPRPLAPVFSGPA